jgi:hypothetical protein
MAYKCPCGRNPIILKRRTKKFKSRFGKKILGNCPDGGFFELVMDELEPTFMVVSKCRWCPRLRPGQTFVAEQYRPQMNKPLEDMYGSK